MPTTIKTICIATVIATTVIAIAIATTATTTAAYPYNDTQELQTVINIIQHERTPENIGFFHKTNVDVTKPFVDIVASDTIPSPQTKRLFLRILLYVIANNPLLHATSLFFKFYYNRTRPYKQFPQQITPLSTSTSEHTPSYPSSHSLQAFAIQKHLTKLYPEHAARISATANRIADSRVIGGVHYPSDKEFARHLAKTLPWI
jgi:acid phosphatase (class A)